MITSGVPFGTTTSQIADSRSLTVGVPELDSYSRASGIGRVLWSLADCWEAEVRLMPERFIRSSIPLLRTIPRGVSLQSNPDLVLLPQLTRAEAMESLGMTPGIVIVHDVGIIDFPEDQAALDWYSRWRVRQSVRGLRHATRIVTVSRFTADRLISHMPELAPRIVAIPNGVSPHFLTFSESREQAELLVSIRIGASLGRPLIVTVGSEHPRKNLRQLLAAFARIKSVFPAAQLLKVGAAGHGSWRRETLQEAELHGLIAGRDILFLEGVDDTDLARCYRAADLYVSASLYEGFGLPLLEAMAIGTAFVVSDRGALPEVAGNAGTITSPDSQSLSQAMLAALDQSPSQHSRSVLQARAREFTWERASTLYLHEMRLIVGQA